MKVSTMKNINQRIPKKEKFANSSRNHKLKDVIISALMKAKSKVKVKPATADIQQPVLYSNDMTTTGASVSKNTITTYLEQEPTTDAFTPDTIQKSRQTSINNSVQRVKERNYYRIDLNALKGCVTSERYVHVECQHLESSPIQYM